VNYLIINDIPSPWREPVFERVYQKLNGAVDVLYFKSNEKRRLWTFPMGSHPKTILRAITVTTGGTERFFNPGLVPWLLRHRPRVALVIANIKDPSGLLAMLTCRLMGTKIALLDDSWQGREQGINGLQRLARRIVYNRFGDAFVGASCQTLNLHKHYNRRIVPEQCFLSHLVADNDYFEARLASSRPERRFDVLFAGRIAPEKNPVFFAEVCAGIKKRLGKCDVLIIGEGREDLKSAMREVFDKNGVTYNFAGFIEHERLPHFYAQAKLLLLPTCGDCWGVVINEAMISGTPVVTTGLTAAAGELVIHDENGFVLPINLEPWITAAVDMLSSSAKWQAFSRNAFAKAKQFNYDTAAAGILTAFRYLDNQRTRNN